MRALGFDASRGEVVAVIEDHVLVPPDWARRIVSAYRQGEDVVGGSVSNAATRRVVDWAAFLCEYSHLLPPLEAGPAETLTGNNTMYRRTLLQRYRIETRAGRWEDYLHHALRRDGITLVCHPEIVVAHKKHYTVTEYFKQRYLYARSYAGQRVADASLASKAYYAAASLALPPVLFVRIVSRVARKRRHRVELLKSLPLIALFSIGWAGGELTGTLMGPGNSLSRVN